MSDVAIVRQGEVLGYVYLEDGAAAPDERIASLLEGVVVLDGQGKVEMAEGERYLAALPRVLNGPVLWAEPLEPDASQP